MTEVDAYFSSCSKEQKRILLPLHDYLVSLPGVEAKIRFKIPFYYRFSWVCYLNPLKNGNVEFCFLHGQKLSNEQGLLKNKGRKMISGIELDPSPFELDRLVEVIQEAFYLDELIAKEKKRK